MFFLYLNSQFFFNFFWEIIEFIHCFYYSRRATLNNFRLTYLYGPWLHWLVASCFKASFLFFSFLRYDKTNKKKSLRILFDVSLKHSYWCCLFVSNKKDTCTIKTHICMNNNLCNMYFLSIMHEIIILYFYRNDLYIVYCISTNVSISCTI